MEFAVLLNLKVFRGHKLSWNNNFKFLHTSNESWYPVLWLKSIMAAALKIISNLYFFPRELYRNSNKHFRASSLVVKWVIKIYGNINSWKHRRANNFPRSHLYFFVYLKWFLTAVINHFPLFLCGYCCCCLWTFLAHFVETRVVNLYVRRRLFKMILIFCV